MKLEVWHQLGFRFNWNFQSLGEDGVGDGVILGPRYMERGLVEELEPRDLNISLFDPQFFLPATPKGELSTYDFFPNRVADGFSTSEFAEDDGFDPSFADTSAQGCVKFQHAHGFPYIIIPTRYLEGLPGDFIQKQAELFVVPFLRAIDEQADHRPVLLQLILNDLMLKDKDYRSDLLNWVTGLSGVTGVYLIISPSKRGKQLKDMELLQAALEFIGALSDNQMEVIVGYTNTEALLLSIAGPKAVTVGCYENMRMFNIQTYQESDEKKMQGPAPRLYVSRMLQWINSSYVPFIKQALSPDEKFFDENRHQAVMFEPTYKWHFTRPELYKHGMLEFSRQLRYVGDVDGQQRYERVRELIERARETYARFDDAGIVFDAESDGSHLAPWLTVANQYATKRGWR